MPYQIDYPWNKNPRLMGATFRNPLATHDIVDALDQIADYMDKALMPLQVVFEIADGAVAEDLFPLMEDSRIIHHEQLGYCVFVNPNEIIRFLAKLLRNKTGVSIEFVESAEEAWDFFCDLGLC